MIKITTIILLLLPTGLFGGVYVSSSSTTCVNGVCSTQTYNSDSGSSSSSVSTTCVNGVCSTEVKKNAEDAYTKSILKQIDKAEQKLAELERKYEGSSTESLKRQIESKKFEIELLLDMIG